MRSFEEVLIEFQEKIDRITLEDYISRQWLRPISKPTGWYFEEIDIERLKLVTHLIQDINVNEAGLDVVLALLDQLYGTRTHIQNLQHAIEQQPQEVQTQIQIIIRRLSPVFGEI